MSKVNLTLNPLVFFNMEFADQVSDIDLRDVDTILKDIGGRPGGNKLFPIVRHDTKNCAKLIKVLSWLLLRSGYS